MIPITVLLADDHALIRDGVKVLLRSEEDIRVIAEARNGREAVELSQVHHPDVVVMDMQMPVLNGIDAIRQVCELLPETKVLVLSSHTESSAVERAVAAGALGYIAKHTAIITLPKAIREVVQGHQFLGLKPQAQSAT